MAETPPGRDAGPTPRLLLIDTVDQLPGLLPLHAWQALRTCDLLLLGTPDHPFAGALEMAEERFEIVPEHVGEKALRREELMAGLSLADKARAGWIIDRVQASGSVGYLFGPDDTDAFTRTLGMEAAREEVEVEVVYFGLAPRGLGVTALVEVQRRLLAPDGCPWDAEQTHESLAPYVIEEAHELAEAIATGDPAAMVEELGDVLMQVVFHAEIAEGFDIDAVAAGITEKLIRRHPHVFPGEAGTAGLPHAEPGSAADVVANWEDIKAAEKPERTGPFDGVPTGLPAIALAAKVQSRAERAGITPPDGASAAEELAEALGVAIDADAGSRAAAVGDVLLAAVALARAADVDPEHALRQAVVRFRQRVEASLGGA